MLNFFEIFLLFLLLPNVALLFLLKKDICKSIGRNFSLLISYGVAPLLNGLFFYYLIWFLPKRSDNFYISLVLLFWALLLFYSRDKIREISAIYKNFADGIVKSFSVKKFSVYFIVFFFTFLFSIQSLLYPISEGDSAYYFLQSEALHQSLDAHWYKSGGIMIDGVNEYYYNKIIRPGIPSSMAFSFMFGQKENNYFLFNFFFVYYYYLLLGMLLLVVSRLAVSLGKNLGLSRFIAFLFFVFYWNMTRFYIFNNKEVVIYFLALAGIYLIYDLILTKQRNIKMELLLGVILGLNSFVNFHGILTGIFSLCILFIFSKLSFWQRIRQVVFIFSANLFFSAFEFVQSFGFIFLNTFRNLLKIDSGSSKELKNVALQHADMYQVNNPKGIYIYIKGKLQMITNVGSYGFYFLFFLSVLVSKLKELIDSVFGKIILLFMAIYYLFIIDPFNLNKNDLAIVLSGSPKYSMLLVLFSIIVVSVYFDSLMRIIFKYVYKNRLLISTASFALALLLYIFKSGVIDFGLKALLGIIQVSRNISFYANKIELFYYVILGFVVFFGFALAIFHLRKIAENLAYRFFFILCLLFMIAPFFIVNVGKVPLSKTFTLLNENRETKLQNTIYFGDLFKVYYYAKNNLPKGTLVRTNSLEIQTYNDYFGLRGAGDSEARHEIINGDCLNSQELYRVGVYSLCQIKEPS